MVQSAAFGGEICLQALHFSAALRFEFRFRLLRRGQELVDGRHLFLRGHLCGHEHRNRCFTVLAVLVSLCMQALQALLRNAQIRLRFGNKGTGGFELALKVAQIAPFDIKLADVRLRILQLSPRVLHLAAQLFELALESSDLGLRLAEFFAADIERDIQRADFITPLLLHVVFSAQGITLLAEFFCLLPQFGIQFRSRRIEHRGSR